MLAGDGGPGGKIVVRGGACECPRCSARGCPCHGLNDAFRHCSVVQRGRRCEPGGRKCRFSLSGWNRDGSGGCTLCGSTRLCRRHVWCLCSRCRTATIHQCQQDRCASHGVRIVSCPHCHTFTNSALGSSLPSGPKQDSWPFVTPSALPWPCGLAPATSRSVDHSRLPPAD